MTNLLAGAVAALICTILMSGCSHTAAGSSYVSRPVPNSHVLLVPELRGGWAGWRLAVGYRTATEGSSGGGALTKTSTGPIFAQDGCAESKTDIYVYALITREVTAVSVYGGVPIPTTTNVTLPDGLRAVAVDIARHNGRPSVGRHCPRLTPLGAGGKPIHKKSKPGRPQAFELPGTKQWTRGVPGENPAWNDRKPAHGACELNATQLPRETSARWGSVAAKIRPVKGLMGQALLSCVDVTYFYLEEHALDAAVLLNAANPGATPPPLPGMKPLTGYPGIFEAPGSSGEMALRRIPGAWLVVEEADEIGLSVPMELLERLHATIHL